MYLKNLFTGFLFWIIPFTLSGQRYISGCITDAEDGKPIPSASVFISGTTVGIATNAEGNYLLRIPGEGSYRLVVSHVGYQLVFRDIESGNGSVVFDVALNTSELEEMTVSTRVRFRQRAINHFWRTILGKPPSKRTIYAINPEGVYYYYNSETRILKVTCREPLEIINNETGYPIRLLIDHFTHDYNTGATSWKWEHKFNELEPENDKQKNLWQENRKKIYRVSITNFIKSLYHNTLMENGFLLTHQKVATSDSWSRLQFLSSSEDLEAILSINAVDSSKMLYIPESNKLLLVCFGEPISVSGDWVIGDSPKAPKFLHTIDDRHFDSKWNNFGLFRNNIHTPDTVRIFPDGTFLNKLGIIPYFSSNPLSGLNMSLPIDYIPDVKYEATPLISEADVLIEDELTNRFNEQLRIFPQEKIYLHIDKPYYISGEKIWFRTYLVDAATHYPVSYSRYVYMELINPLDSIVTRIKILQDEGAYYGYLLIPDDVPEGDYTMRAYTAFMQNLDEHYFCTTTIRIGDPQSSAINAEAQFSFSTGRRVDVVFRFSNITSSSPLIPQSVKVSVNGGRMMNVSVNDDGTANINFNLSAASSERTILLEVVALNNPYRKFFKIPIPNDDFDVAFYPEGGSLIQGVFCKLAFKSMNSNGQAINISGIVFDQSGTEIQKFESLHLGMGSMVHLAEKGKSYYAVCENEKRQLKRFDLPVAVDRGYMLSVNPVRDRIHVSVLKPDQQDLSDPVGLPDTYLLAHTRGMVQYVGLWDHKKNLLVFQSDLFPSGVVHFILFDAGMNPLSERLFFVNNQNQAQVAYQQDKENFTPRSLVKNRVTLTNNDGAPLDGNFSVAVTSDREVVTDSTTNILTQLLLSSDLRGHIENPAYYFHHTNESRWALDLLMRTQGWRRYNIADLAQGHFSEPTLPLEIGAEISGTVKSLLLDRSVEDIEVTVAAMNGGHFDYTKTDKDGRFYLNGGELPDSTRFIVHAVPRKGILDMNLIVDEETFPERTLSTVPPAEIDRIQFARYADKAELKYRLEDGIRVYDLPEVTITAEWKPQIKSDFYDISPFNSISEEKIEKVTDIAHLLNGIAGVSATRSGGGSLNVVLTPNPFDPPPLLVIDNFIMDDFEMIDRIDKYSIAQIDVLKGVDAAIFGMRAAGGAIVIHTKRGGTGLTSTKPVFHMKNIIPLGYQQPVEFYAPKYDTPEKRNAQTPDLRTTIHWQPIVQTDSQGVASFEFYTADDPTSYTVVIEGLANDGSIIRQEGKLWERMNNDR